MKVAFFLGEGGKEREREKDGCGRREEQRGNGRDGEKWIEGKIGTDSGKRKTEF